MIEIKRDLDISKRDLEKQMSQTIIDIEKIKRKIKFEKLMFEETLICRPKPQESKFDLKAPLVPILESINNTSDI